MAADAWYGSSLDPTGREPIVPVAHSLSVVYGDGPLGDARGRVWTDSRGKTEESMSGVNDTLSEIADSGREDTLAEIGNDSIISGRGPPARQFPGAPW